MLRRWNYLLARQRWEDQLDEELRTSFEMTVDRYVASGLSPEAARRAARMDFDGLERVKENVRDTLVGSLFHALVQDARYAWRGLRRQPSFAFLSLLTLALGIGVNTAIFSVFYGILLHPLPYRQPERLVRIWSTYRDTDFARAPVSGPMFVEIQRRSRAFAEVGGIWVIEPRTFAGTDPEQAKCALVTSNFFDVLGVRTALGRAFVKEDSGTPAVVLTSGIFRRRFLADPARVGRRLPTVGVPSTLTGVLPADFQLQFAPDANIPPDVQVFAVFGDDLPGNGGRFLRPVARLKPGVTLAEAQRDLDRVSWELRANSTEMAAIDTRLQVAGVQDDAFGDVRPALKILFAGAAFVLSICCVNVTSLLLARASDRKKEIALRLALGASRGRILRQLLVEGMVLCAIGGAMGIAVGWAGYQGLLAIRPERLARLSEEGLNWPVVGFAAAASMGAALVFGLVPALECWRLNLIATLRSSGKGWLGRIHRRAGSTLVVAEIALGFILVTGASLTARTLARMEHVRPGFDPARLLTFQMPAGYRPAERVSLSQWEAEVAALPGVESVGAISHLPLDLDQPNWYGAYQLLPSISSAGAPATSADYRAITPGYFAAMGVHLLEGRFFDERDHAEAPAVAIVDDLVACDSWPGGSPVGGSIEGEDRVWKIVGVVEHVRNHSLTDDVRGVIYVPLQQNPRSPVTFVVRSGVDPLSLVPAIRAKLHARSPDTALGKVRPMTAYVERAIAPTSFTAVLAAVFGVLALVLAATGIYGVLNYQVSRRLPEMGIRVAVGAQTGDLVRLISGEAASLAAVGVAMGAAGALVAGHWLGSLLYGVSTYDPLSFGLALLLLPAAALLGWWRPALRAATASAADMIREE